ncbi:hypothetical protein CJF42_19365 [Pseudoalteromonas sp. NBT06-2]|uniref:hypothetical protein n=1 Tax=Pseudoalteromonas sp. NBT06-2 TaxID=2025950 RepID=UPI000BA77312|nr:hypothetical protein [Pseudoalteromonas sp. NBT06-2]PAJ72764.1 hypothetical protein CJF42_19365 [Pseudoalteromonas sp. NBT06-2]
MLVTSDYAIDKIKQESFDFNDYIEAVYTVLNKDNNAEKALELIDKAFTLDANHKTIQNKLRLMVSAQSSTKDIDSFVKSVIQTDRFSIWGQIRAARNFIIGTPEPKSIDTAKAILNYDLEKRPGNIQLNLIFSRLYSEIGDFVLAAKYIKEAINKSKDENQKAMMAIMLKKLQSNKNINIIPGFSGEL